MLAIPVMKPEGNLDLTHLERTLRSQNCFSDEMIINDVRKFEQLRKDVVAISDPNDSSQILLLQYFYQLKSLVSRFQPIENEIKFNFTWNDAYVHARKASMGSIHFEIAACLWNLGAFESIRGTRVDRSTDEGIRLAGKHFQQAAGYFDHLKEVVLPFLQSNSLQCLSNDCLNMVKLLMLAQGQLCFYEKAVRDKKRDAMKTGIVAKLAAQTSTFYAQTAVATRTGPLGSILDISWFALADFQAKCFHGAAEYWQALASKEAALAKGSGYGEEIARYNRGESYIRQAVEAGRKNNLLPALISGADSLLNVINTNRQQAQKDISTVYMENIPNEGSLPEVVGVAMVKPSLLPEQSVIMPSFDYLLFKFVLPKTIVDSNNAFYAEINSIYASTATTCENATNFGRSTLSSVGLPGSLESVKVDNSIPIQIWNKILKIQSMGSLERLRSLVSELNNLSKRAGNSIQIIEDSITTEENKDNLFFQQFPHYHGTKSSILDQDIKNNLKLLKDAYNNAMKNDETIHRDFQESNVEGKLLLLTKTREELLKLFPTQTSVMASRGEANLLEFDEAIPTTTTTSSKDPSNALGPDGIQLENKLHELAELFEIRIQQIEKLKSFLSLNILDAVTTCFLNNGMINEIYEKYLKEIHELKASIDSGITTQEQYIADILTLNDKFMRFKETNPLLVEKNRFINHVDEMINKYFALHSQVTAGQTFYTNLQSKLTTLQQNTDDLAYTQQWQRQEFERDQFDEHNRLEQERRDMELARQLASELNIQQQQPPAQSQQQQQQQQPQQPGMTNSYASLYAPQAAQPPSVYAVPATSSSASVSYGAAPAPVAANASTSSGIIYGTPVTGPPATASYQYLQQPAPAQPAVNSTAYPPNPPAVNNYAGQSTNPSPYAGVTYANYATHQQQQQQPQQPQPVPVQTYAQPPNTAAQQNTSNISYASSSNPATTAVYQGQPTQNPYNPYGMPPSNPPAVASSAYGAPPRPAAVQPQYQPQQSYQQPQLYQQQQQQPVAYPPQPPQAQQPQQMQQQPAQPPRQLTPAEMEAKVARVMEMGFPRDQVYSALSQAGWNEEVAINILLGIETGPTNGPPPPAAGPGGYNNNPLPPPAKPAKPSGGGFFWGKK